MPMFGISNIGNSLVGNYYLLEKELIMKHNFKQTALKLALTSALALGAAGLSVNSYAVGSATANLEVTASIGAVCSISASAGALAFGTYNPIGVNALTAIGSVSTTCTSGLDSGYITLSQGNNPVAESTDAAPARQMASGSNRLAYHLYSTSANTGVWGNTMDTGKLAGTGTGTGTGTGSAVVVSVFGTIPPPCKTCQWAATSTP